MKEIDMEQVELAKIICMLLIYAEMQQKTITEEYDKLSFRNLKLVL